MEVGRIIDFLFFVLETREKDNFPLASERQKSPEDF